MTWFTAMLISGKPSGYILHLLMNICMFITAVYSRWSFAFFAAHKAGVSRFFRVHEPTAGIEPASPRYEGGVLPLDEEGI